LTELLDLSNRKVERSFPSWAVPIFRAVELSATAKPVGIGGGSLRVRRSTNFIAVLFAERGPI
jgi:hypothetical protein